MPRFDLFATDATTTAARWVNLPGTVSVRMVRARHQLHARDRWRAEWTDARGDAWSCEAPSLAQLRSGVPFSFRLRARRRG